MWFRQTAREFAGSKGNANRKAMQALVDAGQQPGLLAYHGGETVGWISVAPRTEYTRLKRSRILKPVDNRPVWSIVCLFVRKTARRQKISEALISAAIDYVRTNGGTIVEGYPLEPKEANIPDAFACTGLASSFRKSGFAEVARRSESRLIMRYHIGEQVL
ncbi:GNAT family N-acetyltransferase [Candidatus Neomarinimicrobiota bacterium]